MEAKKSNKISEIVRLQQILKKWRKIANAPKNTSSLSSTNTNTTTNNGGNNNNNNNNNKSIKFLKKTLSFSDNSICAVTTDVVPKGFLAVCVGKEMKRFVIPTEFLGHRAFEILLREAEEEFGFQHEGALRIPCEVSVFERVLKMVEEKKEVFFIHEFGCSTEADFSHSLHSHKPMCR